MTQLKFKGHPDHRVPVPGTHFIGMRPQYIGLDVDENNVATPKEFTIDDSTNDGIRHLVDARRDGRFVPVDEAAHNAVGIPFQPAKKAVTNG